MEFDEIKRGQIIEIRQTTDYPRSVLAETTSVYRGRVLAIGQGRKIVELGVLGDGYPNRRNIAIDERSTVTLVEDAPLEPGYYKVRIMGGSTTAVRYWDAEDWRLIEGGQRTGVAHDRYTDIERIVQS